jgi:hypothetical protein
MSSSSTNNKLDIEVFALPTQESSKIVSFDLHPFQPWIGSFSSVLLYFHFFSLIFQRFIDILVVGYENGSIMMWNYELHTQLATFSISDIEDRLSKKNKTLRFVKFFDTDVQKSKLIMMVYSFPSNSFILLNILLNFIQLSLNH